MMCRRELLSWKFAFPTCKSFQIRLATDIEFVNQIIGSYCAMVRPIKLVFHYHCTRVSETPLSQFNSSFQRSTLAPRSLAAVGNSFEA